MARMRKIPVATLARLLNENLRGESLSLEEEEMLIRYCLHLDFSTGIPASHKSLLGFAWQVRKSQKEGVHLSLTAPSGKTAASVFLYFNDGGGFVWFVWDKHGVSGENSMAPLIEEAMIEAEKATVKCGQHVEVVAHGRKKPKGFGKFDNLMKKLVKVSPEKVSTDCPQKCTVPGCRNIAEDGETTCRGCRKHFGELGQDED